MLFLPCIVKINLEIRNYFKQFNANLSQEWRFPLRTLQTFRGLPKICENRCVLLKILKSSSESAEKLNHIQLCLPMSIYIAKSSTVEIQLYSSNNMQSLVYPPNVVAITDTSNQSSWKLNKHRLLNQQIY